MTRTSIVNGFIAMDKSVLPIPQKVTIRYTEDEHGRTLSLSDEKKVIISVAYEDIDELIH